MHIASDSHSNGEHDDMQADTVLETELRVPQLDPQAAAGRAKHGAWL